MAHPPDGKIYQSEKEKRGKTMEGLGVVCMKGYKNVTGDGMSEAVRHLVSLIVESSKELRGWAHEGIVEHEIYEDEDVTIHAFRVKTGFEDNDRVVKYTEIRVVEVGRLAPKNYTSLCTMVEDYQPFKYRPYYEELFSKVVFILAKKINGRLEPKKAGNTLFVPLWAKNLNDALSVMFMYLANHFGHRLYGLMNSVTRGRVGKLRNLWSKFRLARRGKVDSIAIVTKNSTRYIIELFSEVGSKVSQSLRKTIQVLLNLYTNCIKLVDKFLQPIIQEARSQKVISIVKKELGVPFSKIPLVLSSAINFWRELENAFVRSRLDILSNAEIIT